MCTKLIGLSLSFCVKDILQGVVKVSDVAYIQSSCCFDSPLELFSKYYPLYWSDFNQSQVKILLHTLDIRPRLNKIPNIALSGYWCESLNDVFWLS